MLWRRLLTGMTHRSPFRAGCLRAALPPALPLALPLAVLWAAACGGSERPADGAPGDAPGSGASDVEPAPPAVEAPHDWLVVADTRAGPVSDTTSEQDLIGLLGPQQVTSRDVYLAEGFCAFGSVLYPDTPDELEVIWTDSTRSLPSAARLSVAGSRWRSSEGVAVGTSLAELEQKSGGPVEFMGFGWDYGGGSSWREGGGTLALRLAPNQDSLDRVMRDPALMQVMGEQLVRSDNPLIARLDVRVDRMMVSFGRPADDHQCKLP